MSGATSNERTSEERCEEQDVNATIPVESILLTFVKKPINSPTLPL
jgi:hypothetical protein